MVGPKRDEIERTTRPRVLRAGNTRSDHPGPVQFCTESGQKQPYRHARMTSYGARCVSSQTCAHFRRETVVTWCQITSPGFPTWDCPICGIGALASDDPDGYLAFMSASAVPAARTRACGGQRARCSAGGGTASPIQNAAPLPVCPASSPGPADDHHDAVAQQLQLVHQVG